jgi:hypothetical protein
MDSRLLTCLLVLCALAGCVSSHEAQEKAVVDYCVGKFGHEHNSANVVRCVDQGKAARRKQEEAERQFERQFGTALMAVGFGLMAMQPPPPPQPAPPKDHVCIAANNTVYRC